VIKAKRKTISIFVNRYPMVSAAHQPQK